MPLEARGRAPTSSAFFASSPDAYVTQCNGQSDDGSVRRRFADFNSHISSNALLFPLLVPLVRSHGSFAANQSATAHQAS